MEELYNADQILASAVRFLIDGQDEDAASVLLSCSMTSECVNQGYAGNETCYGLHVELRGPRAAYEVLADKHSPVRKSVNQAIQAVLPSDSFVDSLTVHAEVVNIDPDWRAEMLEIARGRGVHNQAVEAISARLWNNLRFRSQSEIRIAQALDSAGVLFLPNCKARITSAEGRRNREADFLVCHDGKWGILEVDGEPFHPPSRAAADHERDRLFKAHGVRVVEHFDAGECFENADGVVRRFLQILGRT